MTETMDVFAKVRSSAPMSKSEMIPIVHLVGTAMSAVATNVFGSLQTTRNPGLMPMATVLITAQSF